MLNRIKRKIIRIANNYKTTINFIVLQKKYKAHATSRQFNWDWKSVNYNRIALVNLLVGLKGNKCNYLEIGCSGNALFDSIFCSNKVGVDPQSGGTIRETSDVYFSGNKDKFDVIFIDGLHEYEQVKRDAVNALNSLNNGGWIAFHDFLPRNWKEQHVPMVQGTWTGDVWKLAFELIQSKDIDFKILEIDYGVCVMRPVATNAKIVDLSDDLSVRQFDYFHKNIKKLPICSWEDGVRWILSS